MTVEAQPGDVTALAPADGGADPAPGDGTSVAHRLRHWWTARHAVQLAVRLVVPTLLFGRYHRFTYLNPVKVARLLVGDDWTTYLVSPNFLRGAPLLSLPLAKVPGYLAPAGTSLAKTDSVPALMPLYRLLLAILPGRPVQLVGLMLFVAFLGTFNAVARFCDHVRVDVPWAAREAVTLAAGAVFVIAPFWNIQYVHPALMQHWILVWALTGALRRCPTFLGGRFEQTRRRGTGLGPICVAAAVQPYLIPMVALPALAPDFAFLRTRPWWLVRKVLTALAAIVVISVALGYLGGGGKLGSTGFGDYAGDLGTVLDPDAQSRFVADLPSTAGAVGGYGYLGLGAALVAGYGIVVTLRQRRTRAWRLAVGEPGPFDATHPADRAALRWFGLGVGLVTLYALLPDVRLFGRTILRFDRLTDPFSSLTALFRVNGRFVWMALWLALLVGAAYLLVARMRVAAVVLTAAVGLQVADVVPWTPLVRPTETIQYDGALRVFEAQRDTGARSVQFQPPVVIPGCYAQEYGSFGALGDALLAASVAGLSVNSGYTARLSPEHVERNCTTEARAFVQGTYADDVLYVLPKGAETPIALRCEPLTTELSACRTARP